MGSAAQLYKSTPSRPVFSPAHSVLKNSLDAQSILRSGMTLLLALAVLFGLPLAVIAVFGRRQQQLNDAMSKMSDGPSHGALHVGPNDLDTRRLFQPAPEKNDLPGVVTLVPGEEVDEVTDGFRAERGFDDFSQVSSSNGVRDHRLRPVQQRQELAEGGGSSLAPSGCVSLP